MDILAGPHDKGLLRDGLRLILDVALGEGWGHVVSWMITVEGDKMWVLCPEKSSQRLKYKHARVCVYGVTDMLTVM